MRIHYSSRMRFSLLIRTVGLLILLGIGRLEAEITQLPNENRWILTTGPVEYRLKQAESGIVMEYFGPRLKKDIRIDSLPGWGGVSEPFYDLIGEVQGRPLRSEQLQWVSHQIKTNQAGAEVLILVCRHRDFPLELTLEYAVWADTGVITRQIGLLNKGEQALSVGSLPSLAWRLPAGPYELSYLWGAWGRERQYAAEVLGPGRREFVSRHGRSSHVYSPWFALSNNKLKTRYLAQLAWSGNWQMNFERKPGPRPFTDEPLAVELGMRFDNQSALRLKAGEKFELPLVAFTVTGEDLDIAANQMHRFQRRFVVPKSAVNDPPLVQFNSWYPFPGKMTVGEMKRCADIAADLGAEVFVLDAGWYNKKDWSRELGDWQPDPVAFPQGLEELARHVHGKGLKFGLWIEIENVGVDSQMFREHPDWCLAWQGRPIERQSRYPLNFALPQVRQWARAALDRLISSCELDWVKIDYNIEIGDQFDSADPDGAGTVLYRHLQGYYAWLDDLRAAHPRLVIENCSSGGLRFDLGMIGHTHTTWISDEILPLPSLQLAFGSTVEFTPGICNHWMVGEKQDGTVDPTGPAGWWEFMLRVPMNGQYGLSSRVFDWPPDLLRLAKANVALYKRIRPIIQKADVYHLAPPPDHDRPMGWMALQYVLEDGERSVLMAYRLEQGRPEWAFKLRGLAPDCHYIIEENGEPRGIFSSDHLAARGLSVRLDEDWRASVFELTRTNLAPTIQLDGRKLGKTFEGLGALSAGASSRLLVDYPEAQRNQILDLLFKPKFGAAFHHFKVEVGGDINSTDGCEPSHMRDRTDRNFHRGYEWWLMKEARNRNPLIYLDCLQWGAPGWIGNGDFYSQDNADYLIEFLKGARDVHGLNIQFAGVWNETRYDTGWIKLFRKTLDRQGFTNVQLVAADEITRWSIVDVMKTDPELAAAVDVIGTHYPKFKSTLAARQSGKPIWCSEDGPWKGDWDGARELARMYNRNYVDGQMSKTIIWSPVTSYYDILPLPGSGVMRANEPWSGHFETQPALWATAHTTQFAEPGWIYLGGYACGYLPEGGSFVALKSPKNGDYSVIVETSDATGPQTLRFVVEGGLATGAVHLWRSQAEDQFVQLPDVRLTQGSYSVTFEPDSIYSLTTTTGQTKGNPASPPSKPFPMNYSDTFEDYEVGVTPRYFSDQAGAFEIAPRSGGGGKCLRQVVRRKGIEWHLHQDPFPETIMGDANWRDYEVSVDVFLETEGFISLFGRIGKIVQKPVLPEGYWLKLSSTGYWELGTPAVALMSGKSAFKTQEWHNLKLQFTGATLRVFLDGQLLGSIVDRTFAAGMIGLGSGWHAAEFDNLKIK